MNYFNQRPFISIRSATTAILILTTTLFCFTGTTYADQEVLRIEALRETGAIDDFYCKVTTGKPAQLEKEKCSTPNHFPMDVIYVPERIGRQILAHIDSAWDNKWYHNISNSDFFHGHPITRGPKTTYSSPEDYFSDLSGLLYHSEENTEHWRFDTKEPKTPRSFVGYIGTDPVVAAISLMASHVPLSPNYPDSGTIYLDQVIASQPSLSQHTGKEVLLMHTGMNDKPCRILNSVHFIQSPQGRFHAKSGETIDMVVQCKYLP